MKSSEARQGRVFVIRLEHGDVIHESLERFALENGVRSAAITIVGAADKGSRLVVGQTKDEQGRIVPLEKVLINTHELTGTGTIFPDESRTPVLHMHISCGRSSETVSGCVRMGVKVWNFAEVVLIELLDVHGTRTTELGEGYEALTPQLSLGTAKAQS
jgi:predicted DNA-binding protein with PD1-like motif